MWIQGLISWLGVPFLAVAGFLYLTRQWASALQLSGGFLEVLGLAVALVGIERTMASFGGAGPLRVALTRAKVLWGWGVESFRVHVLKRAPKPRDNVTLNVHNAHVTVTSDHLTLWVEAEPDASIERRVELLERNQRELRRTVEGHRKNTADRAERLANELNEERAARDKMDRQLRDLIQDLSTGGLEWEYVGIWWIAVGIVFQTIGSVL